MSSSRIPIVPSGECDECGHELAGMVPLLDGADTVLCTVCYTGRGARVHVKPRFDADEERWYPGGYQKRMKP